MEFEQACLEGDLTTIKSLIATVDINQRLYPSHYYGSYKTYLDIAVSNGHEDVVEYFCSLPDIHYGDGCKPTIYRAVNSGNVRIARMIKQRFSAAPSGNESDNGDEDDYGEDYYGYDEDDNEVNHDDQQPVLDFNIGKGNGECLLGLAVRANKLDMVKFMVEECHMDVNHRNVHGFTPLYIACSLPYVTIDIVEYLLSRPDIKLKQDNINQHSLLHLAVFQNKLELFKLLHPLIDASLKDKWGKTALDYAKERSCTDILDYLNSLSPQS